MPSNLPPKDSSSPAALISSGGQDTQSRSHAHKLGPLILGCLGVVYGDIGTSPLYAMREAVHAAGGADTLQASVVGILSLIIWSVFLVVTIKYVIVLLNADNNGEGGTLSMMALAQKALGKRHMWLTAIGATGAALFFGDALITPAISVLSSVEGLQLVTHRFDNMIIPITLFIIFMLFTMQSRGTEKVSRFFGPIMAVWFSMLALLGLPHIISNPSVLEAFNPVYGVSMIVSHGFMSLFILGAVFLAVTGAEGLYADLGHFGKRPIRIAWLYIVFPALVINYLGQGALLLDHPEAIENPFFLLAPDYLLLPMVIMATVATVIASQAVITGAYSLTRQAVQLGLLPRMEIRHTSEHHSGQIFMPRVNLFLMIGVMLLVVLFGSSSKLASAYGISVTGTMVVTTVLAAVVVWRTWNVRLWIAILLVAPFLIIELTFLSANLLKVLEGGWVPLLFGVIMVIAMLIWVRGTNLLYERQRRTEVQMSELPRILAEREIARVPGTAIFLTTDPATVPASMIQNLKHNKVLHEQNVILTIDNLQQPYVVENDRVEISSILQGVLLLRMRYGYAETPNVLKALAHCRQLGWKFDIMQTTFFLSRRALRPDANSGMPLWQDRIFIVMARNADTASDFFRLPVDHVMEVGTQVKI